MFFVQILNTMRDGTDFFELCDKAEKLPIQVMTTVKILAMVYKLGHKKWRENIRIVRPLESS